MMTETKLPRKLLELVCKWFYGFLQWSFICKLRYIIFQFTERVREFQGRLTMMQWAHSLTRRVHFQLKISKIKQQIVTKWRKILLYLKLFDKDMIKIELMSKAFFRSIFPVFSVSWKKCKCRVKRQHSHIKSPTTYDAKWKLLR